MKKIGNGWVEGSAGDFLGLSAADVEYIETRRALAHRLRQERKKKQMTQTQLAAALKTSQSRVAKMEHADPTVTIDLILQALFQIGLKRKDVASAV